jgi:DNA-binding NarL/FixJ family response regulator
MIDGVVTIRGEREFVVRAGHLFANARVEFACAATDLNTWSRGELREAVTRGLGIARRPGFSISKLFTDRVLSDEDSLRHLAHITDIGARVRISRAELPYEMIMVDRRVVVLGGPRESGPRTYTVLRDPDAVAGVSSMFWAIWSGASDLAEVVPAAPPVLDPQSRDVLRRLVSGATDEAAAGELGLSLRTYRRRVAELMTVLGARSRFQAGARARELGW